MTLKVIKEINLIPAAAGRKPKKEWTFFAILSVVFLLLFELLYMWAIPQLRIYILQKENKELQYRLDAQGSAAERLKLLKDKQAELNAKKQTLTVIEGDKQTILSFLEMLMPNIPDDVFISSITASRGGSYHIIFITHNPLEVVRLLVKLRQMDVFEKVDLDTAPLSTNEETSIEFGLVLKLRSEEKTP